MIKINMLKMDASFVKYCILLKRDIVHGDAITRSAFGEIVLFISYRPASSYPDDCWWASMKGTADVVSLEEQNFVLCKTPNNRLTSGERWLTTVLESHAIQYSASFD